MNMSRLMPACNHMNHACVAQEALRFYFVEAREHCRSTVKVLKKQTIGLKGKKKSETPVEKKLNTNAIVICK